MNEPLVDENGEVRELNEEDFDKMVSVSEANDKNLEFVQKFVEYYQKWHVDLFSPKGLTFLFPTLWRKDK